MNSELITTFMTVANMGNITKSAEVLLVSQATISHRLKQLEEELGIQLILRTKGSKRTTLTATGKAFLPLAQNWLRITNEMNDFRHRPQSLELTIGVVDSINNYLLSDFYKELLQDQFDWRITIKTLHSHEIYEQVRLNTIDIGLPLREQLIPGIKVKKIHSEKLLVVSRHMINNKSTLFPVDLDTTYQIYIPWGYEYAHWHHRFFPPGEPPKFFVDSAKIALDLMSGPYWFLAPYSFCMQIERPCYISKLGLDTPARNLYLIMNDATAQTKRKETVLFKRRLLQYIRRKEYYLETMLNHYEKNKERRSYKSFIHEFNPSGNV